MYNKIMELPFKHIAYKDYYSSRDGLYVKPLILMLIEYLQTVILIAYKCCNKAVICMSTYDTKFALK